MFEVPLTSEALWASARILGVAWLLFGVHWYWNWTVYKKIGPHKSPMYGELIANGCHGRYGSIFGIVYIIAVGATCVIFWWHELAEPPPLNTLIFGTVINYIFASVVVEIWGRHFLRKHGLNPTDKVVERIQQRMERKREERRRRKKKRRAAKAREKRKNAKGNVLATDRHNRKTGKKIKLSPKDKEKMNKIWDKYDEEKMDKIWDNDDV